MGPLPSTNKNYNHIIIDSFSKFVWLYATKSTTSKEVINKLELQKIYFGNPIQIISDKGSAFTSQEFKEYCESEEIKHLPVTTALPRANGQVERLNRTILSVLSKLTIDEPDKWYKYIGRLQQIINSSFHRSIGTTPFELLFSTKLRSKNDFRLKELLEEELRDQFQSERNELRQTARHQILEVQNENRRTYNPRQREPVKYHLGDLIAIKRTQQGSGLKLKPKFLGPYRVIKVQLDDTYGVERVGIHEGPLTTSTCAEYMKPWTTK